MGHLSTAITLQGIHNYAFFMTVHDYRQNLYSYVCDGSYMQYINNVKGI